MSLRERFANWIAPRNADSAFIDADSTSWNGLPYSKNKIPVPSEVAALQVSAIYAAVNLISGAIATLPVNLYNRAQDGNLTPNLNDSINWILNEEMNPRWSAASAWEYLVVSVLLRGDAFAKILRRGDGTVLGLMPIHPDRVRVVPSEKGLRLIYVVEPDPSLAKTSATKREVLDQDDMLHVPGFGFDGLRGLSPLYYALRMAGSVAIATQDYSSNFFANSARPDYVLQSEQALAKEKVDQLYARLDERHRGTENAHRPMVLTSGLKVETISMPLKDMELLDQRKFQIEEIARIYGVPAFMIGHTEKTTSWGTGVESMGVSFVRYTLRPHLNKFETEINRKFFRTASRVAKFDTTELEKADTQALFTALRTGVGRSGEKQILSVNEARRKLNLGSITGGDDFSDGDPHALPDPDPSNPDPSNDGGSNA